MKKLSAVISAIVLGFVAFGAAGSAQAGSQFSPPIPMRSDVGSHGQLAQSPDTKVDATNLKFFEHPKYPHPALGGNYSVPSVLINGTVYPISDLVATPGLLPPDSRKFDIKSEMLDAYGPRPGGSLDPLHGFCTGPVGNNAYEDCEVKGIVNPVGVFSSVDVSRQLQVADIRDALQNEMGLLKEQDPLIEALIGSSHESKLPYDVQTYPATVITKSGYLDGVIAYGIADFDAGVVTATYDPLMLSISMQDVGNIVSPVKDILNQLYISPLAFFRKDAVAGRMRLAGYSGMLLFDPKQLPANPLEVMERLLLLPSSNPVSVASMPVAVSFSGAAGSGAFKTIPGFAVVNQATVVDLDMPVKVAGHSYADPSDFQTHNWGDYLVHQNGSPITSAEMPHRLFSYASFWGQGRKWGGGDPTQPADMDNFNPNAVFTPKVFAMIGRGAFDAAMAVDTKSGTKYSLVVPSGEVAENNTFYLYKVFPYPTSANQVYIRTTVADANPTPMGMIIPTPYEIEVPPGFAPYGIASADIDGDGCADFAVTFRGATTVALKTPFNNQKGENVVFQNPADQTTMFSNYVYIYKGDPNKNCAISPAPSIKQLVGPKGVQIAAVALADIDGDNKVDLLVGDLIPRQIPDGKDKDKYTAYAYLFSYIDDPNSLHDPFSYQSIRVGFNNFDNAVGPISAADLLDIARGAATGKTIGVAALAVDRQQDGSNIGAINGLPLALPPFGCPSLPSNIEVKSGLEELIGTEHCGTVVLPRVARGQIMPGPREMTVVVKMGASAPPGPIWTIQQPIYRKVCPAGSDCTSDAECSANKPVGGPWVCANCTCQCSLTQASCPPGPDEVLDKDKCICTIRPPLSGGGKCNYNGSVDLPGEKCDTAGLPKDKSDAQLAQKCTNPPPGGVPDACDMKDCTCSYKQLACANQLLPLAPGKCQADGDCNKAAGERCLVDCSCGVITPAVPPSAGAPGGETGTAWIPSESDCTAQVLSWTSNDAHDKMEALNDAIAKVTLKPNYQLLVENEQRIRIICKVGNASMPGATKQSLSLSVIGDPLPDSADMIRPYALVQTGGSVFLNFYDKTKMEYNMVKPVETAIRIMPLPSTTAQKGITAGKADVILPLLTGDLAATVPMTDIVSDMPVAVSSDAEMINDMIRHQMVALGTGQSLSLSADGITFQKAQAVPVQSDSPQFVLHITTVSAPADCASFAGVEGYTGCPHIEEQNLNLEALKAALASRVTSGQEPNASIFSGLPWEPYRNNQFTLVQDVYAKANSIGALAPIQQKFAFLTVNPNYAGQGGCKGCFVSGAVADLDSVLPTLIAVLFTVGGIAAGRVRRGRK
ncbi:MAG: VCBS repeat-containing protein [Pseudomonadota bacterium]